MRTAKKALGIVLVLAMLLNVVALVSYAEVPADTACKLILKADKANYNAGDEIVLTVYAQTAEAIPQVTMAGQFEIGYLSTAIEPYAPDSADLSAQGFTPEATVQANSFANSESQFVSNSVMMEGLSQVTEGREKDYDSICGYWISQPENQFVDSVAAPAELFSFKMRVKDTAADGDYVIAFNKHGFDCGNAYVTDSVVGSLTATPEDMCFADMGLEHLTNMFVFEDVTIHVGAATAESIIRNGGNQIRFRGVGIDGNFSAYENVFDVRTVAKISATDFKARFGATDAEALEKIKDIGFVFAPMSETFEMDAAIALAKKDTTGQVSEGIYTKKPCKYIGHESADADYIFTCIVENIEDTTANRANGFTCLAYACDVDGNYYFFDAAATANYQDLFTAHFKG